MRITENDLKILKTLSNIDADRMQLIESTKLAESSLHYSIMRLIINSFITVSNGVYRITKQGKQIIEITK